MNGVDLAIKDQDGFTAAELAEYNGHNQCAKYLRTVENMVLLFDGFGVHVRASECVYIYIKQANMHTCEEKRAAE